MDSSKNSSFDIDDILREVKQKKQLREENLSFEPVKPPKTEPKPAEKIDLFSFSPPKSTDPSSEAAKGEPAKKSDLKLNTVREEASDEIDTDELLSRFADRLFAEEAEKAGAAEIKTPSEPEPKVTEPELKAQPDFKVTEPEIKAEPILRSEPESFPSETEKKQTITEFHPEYTLPGDADDTKILEAFGAASAASSEIKIDDTLHEYFGKNDQNGKKSNTSVFKSVKSGDEKPASEPKASLGDTKSIELKEDVSGTKNVELFPSKPEKKQKNDPDGKTEKAVSDSDIPEEYTSRTQAETILEDLYSQRSSLILRLVITAIIFLAMLFLTLTAQAKAGLPDSVSFSGNPQAFMIINIILLAVGILVCNAPVGSGLSALFRLKANSDSLTACSAIVCLFHSIILAFTSRSGEVPPQNLYFSVAMLALAFNSIGKLSMINRIISNFKMMTEEYPACALAPVNDKNLAKDLSGTIDSENCNVAYRSEADFFSHFLELSYGDDLSDSAYRTLSPVMLGFSVLIAAITLIFSGSIVTALSCLAALLAIGASFSATLASNLPFSAANKSLLSYGSSINGSTSVETFDALDSVMLEASDIFTRDCVILYDIKSFSKTRIDEAIIDAASVINQTKSPLSGVFDKVIDGNKSILKDVDSIVYEDGMGLSAWVNSQRVLIGNRTLMMNHGIDVPSTDFEERNSKPDQNILYLSNSGELTAMFVLGYTASITAAEAMNEFKKQGISIIVNSNDPNVTSALLSKLFDFPAAMINVVPANLQREFSELTKKREASPAFALYDGTVGAAARIISYSCRIKRKTSTLLLIQIIAMILGFAIVAFFSFSGIIGMLGYLLVMFYQLIWAALTAIISTIGWK